MAVAATAAIERLNVAIMIFFPVSCKDRKLSEGCRRHHGVNTNRKRPPACPQSEADFGFQHRPAARLELGHPGFAGQVGVLETELAVEQVGDVERQ